MITFKKFFYILFITTLLMFLNNVYANNSQDLLNGRVTIIDKTSDGVHDGMSSRMTDMAITFVNDVVGGKDLNIALSELQNKMDNFVGVEIWGSAPGGGKVTFDPVSSSIKFGCTNNGDLMEIKVNPTPEELAARNTPPPPPPVISTRSTSSSNSCSYISSRTENWSSCTLNSNWSTAGTATCYQTSSWNPNYSTASWSCTTTTTLVDGVPSGSSTSCDGGCPGGASRPANRTATKNINISLSNPTSNCNYSTYADNNSSCSVRVNISGTTNGGADIVGLNGKQVSGITNLTNIHSNRIDNIGGNALNFSSVGNTTIQGGLTNYYFDISGIKSISPFYISNGNLRFNIQGLNSITNLTLSNITYGFKKPFTGTLTIDGGDTLKIGTQQTAKINVTPKSILNSYNISNFSSSLNPLDTTNFLVQNKNGETSLSNNPTVNFTLNYKGDNSVSSTQIQTNPIISYSLGGENVKYYLNNESASYNGPILSGNSEFIGVKIIGTSQAIGRQEVTTDKKIFTDLSISDTRSKIKQKAYELIKGRTADDDKVLNGVKYVTGDKNLSSLISGGINFKTLILKNGNLTIDRNITSPIGIIVIRDNNSDKNIGNIYIKPDVAYINSIIYSDGGLISSGYKDGEDRVEDYKDSTIRSSTLNKQLVLKGSLFTRNTIGGALATGGKYILPGGFKIDANDENYNKALMYDLNYIRRNNIGFNDNDWTKKYNMGIANSFVIIYDSNFISNPPAGF